MIEKKLQVFVSSTFIDLRDERQKAVEGILRAGHIPAGMELFIPGDKTQWEIIENWIKESDVLMLILGGRYGSIDPSTGKSYTQMEYEFALENKIPVFALVLSDQYLADKKSKYIDLKIYEHEEEAGSIEAYRSFKKSVTSKLVKFISNIHEIPTEVSLTLQKFIKDDNTDYHFKGWIRGSGNIPEKQTITSVSNFQPISKKKQVSANVIWQWIEDTVSDVTKRKKEKYLRDSLISYPYNFDSHNDNVLDLLDSNNVNILIEFLNHLETFNSHLKNIDSFYKANDYSKEMPIMDARLNGLEIMAWKALEEIKVEDLQPLRDQLKEIS